MKKSLHKALILLFMMFIGTFAAIAQSPVTWKTSKAMTNTDEGYIFVTATIEDGWHIYGLEQTDNGPVATAINFAATPGVTFIGRLTPLKMAKTEMDDMFGVEVKYWSNEITFARKFKIANGTSTATVPITVTYMCCDDSSCRPPVTENLSVKVK